MKKINWSYIGMLVLLIAATLIGAYLMEETWMEDMSGWIWIVGEICIASIWMVKELDKIASKYFGKKD